MQDWIKILVGLVQDDPNYTFGTTRPKDIKMATPEAKIEIRPDSRWEELVRLGEIFGKSTDK